MPAAFPRRALACALVALAAASARAQGPAPFVQTDAFRLLCAAAAAGALWALVQWRQRRATAAVRARYDAVLAERARVARELHDTLLSDMTAVAMRLDAAATAPGARAGVDVAVVADVRDQARRAVAEARRALVGLRASPDDVAPLWGQLEAAARRVFASTEVDVRVERSGTPRWLPPAVEAEVVRIASEAMTNARTHAGCRTVVASCAYGRHALTLRLRDDGRGFDPGRAAANGHFGLTGMRERAAAIDARLAIDSAPGRGTELRLVVPVRLSRRGAGSRAAGRR